MALKGKKKVQRNKKRAPAAKMPRVNVKVFFSRLATYTMTAGAIVVVCFTFYLISLQVTEFLNKPIAEVSISGEFNYIQKEDIASIAEGYIEHSFVRENLSALKEQLEDLPWVDAASLRRQWPNDLHVAVVEQKPIARWGSEGFINYRGEVVNLENTDQIMHFPVLYGAESDGADLMQQYGILAQLLKNYGLQITSLKKDHLGVWRVSLNNQWQIVLGRSDTVSKFKKLTMLLEQQVLSVNDKIRIIDMRYQNGLAVAWDESDVDLLSAVKP